MVSIFPSKTTKLFLLDSLLQERRWQKTERWRPSPLTPGSQTRTRRETAGKTMLTSTVVRRSRVRNTSLASSLRRTSKQSALLLGLRSGTSREKKAPSLPTSRDQLLCVVYFNPNQKIHENICCAVA